LFLKEQTEACKQNARGENKTSCLNIAVRYDIVSALIIT